MSRRTVDSIASAVVRRINSPGRRPRPGAALVASRLTVPQLARPRRGGTSAPQTLDLLANKLASAVTRRLAGTTVKPGVPLVASRMTRAIVRQVGKQLGKAPGREPVALSTVDPAAAAKVLTERLGAHDFTPADPAVIVASTILRRLRQVRLVGTPAEARAFQGRVASIVTASLRPAAAEAPAAVPVAEEVSVTVAAPASADATASSAAGGSKRSSV